MNGVMARIYVPQRQDDEDGAEWRKEGDKDILKVYSSPYIYSYDFRVTVFGL
jgi:hypothetical protein